jgi:hypothetical protein
MKWLRYYLDFCRKYDFAHERRESLPHFLSKLEEKRQTKEQQQQAAQAIEIYYELILSTAYNEVVVSQETISSGKKTPSESSHPLKSSQKEAVSSGDLVPRGNVLDEPSRPLLSSSRGIKIISGASWKAEYTRLAQEIQVRHYSSKTLKTYTQWVRHFQTFTRSLDPQLLSSEHVKRFLTYLAVTRKVSASTQNQAFNAMLFFLLLSA